MVNQLITGMIHAKQLLSFLAVTFIPAIIYCYGQERNSSAIVYLQKIELQDTTLKRVVSDIIKDYPNDFKQGHWYLMDYFSSGAGGSGFFMLDEINYDYEISRVDQNLSYFFEIDGVYMAAPKGLPSKLFKKTDGRKRVDLIQYSLTFGASFLFLIHHSEYDIPSYSIWSHGTTQE